MPEVGPGPGLGAGVLGCSSGGPAARRPRGRKSPTAKRSRRQRNNENRENASSNRDHDDVTSGTPKEKKAQTSKKKQSSMAKA
ncbi:hypothetical protein H8959_020033 [Pygathrix nigripes]